MIKTVMRLPSGCLNVTGHGGAFTAVAVPMAARRKNMRQIGRIFLNLPFDSDAKI